MKVQPMYSSVVNDFIAYETTSVSFYESVGETDGKRCLMVQAGSSANAYYTEFVRLTNTFTFRRATPTVIKRSITFRSAYVQGWNRNYATYVFIGSQVTGTSYNLSVSPHFYLYYAAGSATTNPNYAEHRPIFKSAYDGTSLLNTAGKWYTIDFIWQVSESDSTHYRYTCYMFVNGISLTPILPTPTECLKTDFSLPNLFIVSDPAENNTNTPQIQVLVIE